MNYSYNFFTNEGKIFTLEQLMNIFFFVEHLCFNELSETLQPEYKREISVDLKKKIEDKLSGLDKKNIGFTVRDLAAAVRRYISRYIAGKRESADVDEKRDLSFDLSRIDLWEEKIGRLNDLDDLLIGQIGEFKLNVGQAYEFYKLIQSHDLSPFDENIQKK